MHSIRLLVQICLYSLQIRLVSQATDLYEQSAHDLTSATGPYEFYNSGFCD